VFLLNAEPHPRSANAFDSLGDAYRAAGDDARAIESHQKALARAPQRKTAASARRQLTHNERRPLRPITLAHIAAGTLALLAGAVPLASRKGARWHDVAGNAFGASTLGLSISTAYLALAAPAAEANNLLLACFSLYLVVAGWWAARQRDGGGGAWGAPPDRACARAADDAVPRELPPPRPRRPAAPPE
jgi:Predicted membrane protein (DUF2306)